MSGNAARLQAHSHAVMKKPLSSAWVATPTLEETRCMMLFMALPEVVSSFASAETRWS
jgi:hypothetical protein